MPPYDRPPLSLGLALAPGYVHRVRGEDVPLWTAPTASPALLLALKHQAAAMRRAGYLHFHVGDLGMRPIWWPARCVASPAELAALQADVDRLVAADAAATQDDAARRAGLAAEVAASDRAAAEAALPRLAALVAASSWQLGRALPSCATASPIRFLSVACSR